MEFPKLQFYGTLSLFLAQKKVKSSKHKAHTKPNNWILITLNPKFMNLIRKSFIFISAFFIACQQPRQNELPIKHNVIPEGFVQKAIPYALFKEKFDKRLDYERILTPGKTFTDKQIERIYIGVWNDLFLKALLDPEVKYLGLEITAKETEELLFGEHAHAFIKELKFLKDPWGNFSPELAKKFVYSIQNDTAYGPRLTWEVFFDDILTKHLKEKHSAIIRNTFYFTPAEKQFFEKYFTTEVDFDYVFKGYQHYVMQTPPDSLVARLYYDYMDDYFKPEMRRISYIQAQPLIDSAYHLDELKRFLAIRNHANADFQTIASNNKELKYYSTEYTLETTGDFLKNFFLANDTGSIIGPYFSNNSFNYIRIAEKYERPDSVKIRMIALTGANINKVSQLMQELIQKNNFHELAKKYSSHKETSEKGGELGWVTYGSIPEPFNTACFSAPAGRIFELPGKNTNYIIQVTELSSSSKSYVYAEGLVYQLTPNQLDNKKMEKLLRRLSENSKTPEELFAAAIANGFATQNVTIQNTYYIINDIPDSHDMVQWSFSNPIGKVSPPFKKGNYYYILAVNEIIPTGYVPLSEVIDPLRTDYIVLARKDSLYNKYKEITLPGKSLKDYGKVLNSEITSIKNAPMISYTIPNLGVEPELKGILYGMKTGEISPLVKGEKGIYVLHKTAHRQIKSSTEPKEKMEKQFLGDVEADIHLGNISYVAKPFMNFVRKQDSYYLSKNYTDTLLNDPRLAEQMVGAEFLFRQHQWEKALDGTAKVLGFRQLIQQNNQNSRQLRLAKIYAAICFMKLNRYNEAIETLASIPPTQDFFSTAFIPMMIADAYSMQGNTTKAIEYYKKAIELSNSAFYKTLIYIKLIVHQIQHGDLQEAYNTALRYKELHIESTYNQIILEITSYLKWETTKHKRT